MKNFNYELEQPEIIGPVPTGIRVNFYCLGDEITGPKLQGRCRAVGGDWLTVRTDGVGILDVRTTLESHDGALIDVSYNGVGDLGSNGYQNFLEGITSKAYPACNTKMFNSPSGLSLA